MILVGPIDVHADEIRLKVFRDQHPDWHIYAGEFGTWHAERDTERGSDTHVRYQLSDLLDLLDRRIISLEGRETAAGE